MSTHLQYVTQEEEEELSVQEGSVMAARAEKIFLSHMEIIRLKYPRSLARLQAEAHSDLG